MLDRLPFPSKMSDAQVARSRKYAYHFFFRRMIPLRSLKPLDHWPLYHVGVSQLEDLKPGVDPGLDLICDGILSGTPFVYPEEMMMAGETREGVVTNYSA